MCSLADLIRASPGRCGCRLAPQPSPARGPSRWIPQRGAGTSHGHKRGLRWPKMTTSHGHQRGLPHGHGHRSRPGGIIDLPGTLPTTSMARAEGLEVRLGARDLRGDEGSKAVRQSLSSLRSPPRRLLEQQLGRFEQRVRWRLRGRQLAFRAPIGFDPGESCLRPDLGSRPAWQDLAIESEVPNVAVGTHREGGFSC